MTTPSIVAIIPLYNGARWIEDCLHSVLGQTLPASEIIVVDDGSDDGGAAIVRQLASGHPQIRLLTKSNGGQSSARNHGVKQSSGSLIAFLDQDDTWYANHLEVLAAPFTQSRGIPLGWSWSDLDEIDAAGNLVVRGFLSSIGIGRKTSAEQCVAADMMILPSAALISREAFESIGGFDGRLSGFEDDDLFLRLLRAGYDNVYIDVPLSKWRIYPGSTAHGPNMTRSRMTYARKLLAWYPADPGRHRNFPALIAPRFVAQIVNNDYGPAVRRGDVAGACRALDDLALFVPFLSRKRRLAWKCRAFLCRRMPWLARLILR